MLKACVPKVILHGVQAEHCTYCGKVIDMSKYEITKYVYKIPRKKSGYDLYCGWNCQKLAEDENEAKKKKRKPSPAYDGYAG